MRARPPTSSLIVKVGLTVRADVMITAGTTYYLLIKPRKNGATSKDAVVHSPMTRVVLVTARTNLLSLAVQLVTLVRRELSSAAR